MPHPTAMKIACLLPAVLLAACAFPEPKVEVRAPLPIELAYREGPEGLVLMTGRVNDKQDVSFILDTGAPVTVLIDGKRTRELGLDTREARSLGDPDDPATPVGVIRKDFGVTFGPVALSGLSAVVIPEDRIPCPERVDAIGFAGVVGADLFRRFVVEIDPAAKRVRLHDPAAWQLPTGATVIPLTFRGNHPSVPAKIRLASGETVEREVHLDTGMTKALSLVAGSHPAIVMPKQGKTRKSCLVGGMQEERVGAPASVSLGGRSFEVGEPIYSDGTRIKVQKNGAIGIALFRDGHLAIDYPGKRIVVF
jgi:hypothetical protein